MFGLNSYLSADNASDYVRQLFGAGLSASSDPAPMSRPNQLPGRDTQPQGPSARERALEKIMSLIWNMQNGGQTDTSSVDEQNGYILNASGTAGADQIDMQAIAAYNIDTAAGDDTVNVKAGSLSGLTAGDGNDKVNLAAAYMSDIDGGRGNDAIEMAGDFAGNVNGGAGNDTIKISAGTILGANGGDGNDTLYLEGARIFAAGGAGNDTITINNTGDKPAELSFAKGDGKDTVNSTGPLDIRFGLADFFANAGGSPQGLKPDDVTITVSDNKLIVRAQNSGDAITINFDPSALGDNTPSYEFAMDKGDYVLQIR
jgi:Ca2+-binding RTX toxin-like protein